jgi:hypothetical protein
MPTQDSTLMIFNIFDPSNLMVFISVFSPVILALIVVSSSVVFGYEKGVVYLGFLLASTIVREVYYYYNPPASLEYTSTICKSVQYGTKNSNSPLFSSFVFAFTILYMIFPMYSYGTSNFTVFATLLVFLFFDIFVKLTNGCFVKYVDVIINLIGGSMLALILTSLMIYGGSGRFLFFNELSSNREVCSMPSEQTFKCSVYKNGELLGAL